jgi:hypothetical protein
MCELEIKIWDRVAVEARGTDEIPEEKEKPAEGRGLRVGRWGTQAAEGDQREQAQ